MRLVAVTGCGQCSDQVATQVAAFDEHFTKPVNLKRSPAHSAAEVR